MIKNKVVEGTIDASLIPRFTDFFLQEHVEDLNEVLNVESPSITMEYDALYEFDPDLAEGIVDEPLKYYVSARKALRELPEDSRAQGKIDGAPYDDIEDMDSSNRNPLGYIDLRISEVPNAVQIRQIRASDVTDMVSIEGRVKKKTEVLPKVDVGYYKCTDCGEYTTSKQPLDDGRDDPENCSACGGGPLIFDWNESHLVNLERIEIEENPEALTGGETPQSIKFYNWGDTAGVVNPGQRVTGIGILEPEQDNDSAVFAKRVRGINIKREQEAFEDLEISDKEIEEIKELASRDNIYELIRDSIAPAIYGYEQQKFALALALFGGVTKQEGSSYIRGDIHTLSVGDPGTGKSELLEYAHTLAPRGVYTSGKGSSSAGLTAAAVREETLSGEATWTLEAGALVLADKGIAAIDEIDKMESGDRDSLHEALQSQKISVNKAGINATLKARCGVLAAANPKLGKFDQYEPISEQIDLDPALISRFDLIFTITDTADRETDSKIAQHIISVNQSDDEEDEIEEEVDTDGEEDDVKAAIPVETLQKYIAYARNNCFPELSDEAGDRIEEFYVELRQESSGDTRSATARQLQSLVRLAEASARMRLSDEVELRDAEVAIDITRSSLEEVSMDPETGELDAGMLESGISGSKADRRKDVKNIINALEADFDDGVPQDELLDNLQQNSDITESQLEETLSDLIEEREIYEPRQNHYSTL